MAAMNNGANDGNGHIVGVIHEKFVVDGSDWFEGAHSVFREGRNEILIARGNDLQERKKLLVENADALIVLPGGPGTWDEVRTFCIVIFIISFISCVFISLHHLYHILTIHTHPSPFVLRNSCGKWHVHDISDSTPCRSYV